MSQSQLPPPSSQRQRPRLTAGPAPAIPIAAPAPKLRAELPGIVPLQRISTVYTKYERKRLPALEPAYFDRNRAGPAKLVDAKWPDSVDSDAHQTRLKRLTAIDEGGIFGLYDELVERDKKFAIRETPFLEAGNRHQNSEPTTFVRSQSLAILAILPPEVITGMITGRMTVVPELKSKHIPNKDNPARPVKDPAGKNAGTSTDTSLPELRPAIYCNVLANGFGRWLTKNQMLKVLNLLDVYILGSAEFFAKRPQPTISDNDIQKIRDIDTVKKTKDSGFNEYDLALIPQGMRKYIENKRGLVSLMAWLKNMRLALDFIPAGKEDDQLPWSVYETGWSIAPVSRLASHKAHHQGMHVMNLIEAVMATISGLEAFHFEQYIVLELWKPDTAVLAQHIVSLLTMSYVRLGGCNSLVTGESVRAAYTTEAWFWHFWANRLDWKTINPRLMDEVAKIRMLKEQYDEFQLAMTFKRDASSRFKQLKSLEEKIDKAEEKITDTVKAAVPALTKWLSMVQTYCEVLKEEREMAVIKRVAVLLEEHIVAVKAKKRQYEELYTKHGLPINWKV